MIRLANRRLGYAQVHHALRWNPRRRPHDFPPSPSHQQRTAADECLFANLGAVLGFAIEITCHCSGGYV